jgi:hypothetical protein
MLVRLLYVSRSTGPQTTTVTGSILETALRNNRAQGITGVLCQGQGLFVQVLEGERDKVNRLYARIQSDDRHHDVQLLLLEDIVARRFPQWSMAHVSLGALDPMVQLIHPDFKPDSAAGVPIMKQMDVLLETSERIQLRALLPT